jgi:hypothetical protein
MLIRISKYFWAFVPCCYVATAKLRAQEVKWTLCIISQAWGVDLVIGSHLMECRERRNYRPAHKLGLGKRVKSARWVIFWCAGSGLIAEIVAKAGHWESHSDWPQPIATGREQRPVEMTGSIRRVQFPFPSGSAGAAAACQSGPQCTADSVIFWNVRLLQYLLSASLNLCCN